MAEESTESTALSVVETQQNIVGGAMVGAAGTGVLAEAPTDSTTQILEQIRDIQVKTLRGISDIGKTMREIFDLDKLQDRRAKEDQTELDKEKLNPDDAGADVGGQVSPQDADKASGGIFGFFGALPGAGMIKKLFAPILAFFGKSGLLVKLFGKFGPLGALILGFTLVYKYSDEIAAALAPAIDKLKVLITKMQPLIDFLIKIGDFFIKTLLENLGGLIENIIDSVTKVVDGFIMLFNGDILGGLKAIIGGLFDFVLAIPKAILNTVIELLSPLATAVGYFFKQLYDDIVTYVTDTITNIKNFFIDLKDKIVQFFVDAYEKVKQTITDAIDGAFNFVADIFDTIKNFFVDGYNNVVSFVTGLPDQIMGFVRDMFSPITDFFAGIGNRIKQAVNGIIDALPLPDFVKDKMKFDITPTEAELKDAESMTGDAKLAEKIALDEAAGIETIGGKYQFKDGVLQENGRNLERFQLGFAEALAERIGDQVKVAFDKKSGKYVIVKSDMQLGESGATSLGQEADLAAAIGENDVGTNVRLPVGNIPDLANDDQGAIVVNNNNYNTSNSSVSSQTDVHSGKLDTGIDSYFDKVAFNARGYS